MIPNTSIPTAIPGALTIQVGRYAAEMSDVYDRYVVDPQFAKSTSRAAIWDDWQQANAMLKAVTPIVAVWLGGSFITNKINPSDIDCLYWLDVDDVANAHAMGAKARGLLGTFSTKDALKASTGLRVDSFVGWWRSIPDPRRLTEIESRYYKQRGHWDDFWQREKITKDPNPKTRADSLLRRGYLEVIIDGIRG